MQPKTQQKETEPRPETEEASCKHDAADICGQLMSRYSASAAPQHRHLLATAAAIRSILSAESLPLTPPAYFAAAIDNLSDSKTLDSTAIAALLSFVSVVVPLIPEKGINEDKAREAVGVLVGAVEEREGLGVATVSGAVKCLGVLVLGFCDLDDWASVKLGFESLLKFSVDKRPKVRRSAQDCLEKVFGSFSSSVVVKEASKSVFSLVRSYMPMSLNASRCVNVSKDETLSKPEHLEVIHMLNLLKTVAPFLSGKVNSKVLCELHKLLSQNFSPITGHILNCIEAFFESGRNEAVGTQSENIIDSLALYVSMGEKNPTHTVISAAKMLKKALDNLSAVGSSSLMRNLPKVVRSLAGLLICESTIASQSSDIMKEVIKQYIDCTKLSTDENQLVESVSQESEEADAIRLICAILEKLLSSCNEVLNEPLCGAISVLFQVLGKLSIIFMNSIVLKLADLMNHAGQDNPDTHHLEKCLGSAVVAMGPQRILERIPISINADDFTCSNTWLVPILKSHVVGASLEYYMEHIVPLAKSFERAHKKVKKSVIGQDLQAHAEGLWGLLPAFCQYPVDTHKKFGSLADLLIKFLKKDSFMHQHIAFALQVLVNQNKSALQPDRKAGEFNTRAQKDHVLDFRGIPCYSNKTAKKNIRALGSCSTELLRALVDLFVDSLPDKRLYMKDAIGCLASITDSSITKNIFVSLLQRFEVVNSKGEFEKKVLDDEMIDEERGNPSAREKDVQRCALLDLAAALVEGAGEDLVELIYDFIVYGLQANHMIGQCEAYRTLSRVLEEHSWFRSCRLKELIDLFLGWEPSTDISCVRHRFACFRTLMVHMLEKSLEEEDTKAFLILNEIIITLKNAKDEARKVAYDTLLMISSSLRDSSHVNAGGSYHKLISMIMGYLPGSSPHVKSGAVSALSVVVHGDAEVCLKIPDVVPSVLSLLQGKAVEVIKAALGFAKVLVSCLPAKDLQKVLSEVVSGVLPWSSVSRHHFREKVTIILEIITRKCGSTAVEAVAPEKYKRFVMTVFQNRHHKSTSKDAVATKTETVLEDSSIERPEKQKHNDLGSFPNGQGSVHHRKRKRGNKQYEGPPDSRAPHITAGDGSGPQDAKRAKNSKRKMLVKVPLRDKEEETPNNESNDWKKGVEHKSMRKKLKVPIQMRSSSFRHSRHRKLGKQKTRE